MRRKILFFFLLFLALVAFLFILRKVEHFRQERLISSMTEVVTGEIRKGESLYLALVREEIPRDKIILLEKALKPVFDVKKSQIGDRYELERDLEGHFKNFKYYTTISPIDFYLVEKNESGKLVAKKERLPVEKKIARVEGRIETSLYEAMIAAGQKPSLTMDFADIFDWEIDFLTEPRPGDRFRLVWEEYWQVEKKLADGRILAAQYINRHQTHTAIYFEDPEGNKSYFTEEGKSLRKQFLRSPLSYRRISSYFSYRRFHPILKVYRPHPGIDYAAPIGTPVRSIGEGRVVYKGWKGGFGRFIKIKHKRGYYTTYGHLRRYAKGIRTGVRVSQGQVIGYVGSSGLSTGPHLHFAVIKNGRYINFLRLKLPAVKSVKKEYLKEFNRIKEERLTQLESISSN
ncbi:MAG TPA: M23 family metallopeptidase [bacterium]|nr:M23 family metallopeptidase [bacterium]